MDLAGRPRITALAQAIIVVLSGSVALLGDTLHNVADALTAVPLGIAFLLGRRAATRAYTYGYGRAEDLAGIIIVVVIAASAVAAAWTAITRLLHPAEVTHVPWVAAAGLVGFLGNELVAQYRIRVGRRIGSAALIADGLHARTDGYTSLAVLAAAGGAALGWRWPTRSSAWSSPPPLPSSSKTPPARSTDASWTPSTPPSSTRPKPPYVPSKASKTWHRSGSAGSATDCTPKPNSSWTPTSPSSPHTRSRPTPSINSPTPCPG